MWWRQRQFVKALRPGQAWTKRHRKKKDTQKVLGGGGSEWPRSLHHSTPHHQRADVHKAAYVLCPTPPPSRAKSKENLLWKRGGKFLYKPRGSLGVLSHGARTLRPLLGVSKDFTQWRGPQQTTLAGVPKCLWMVTKGLWVKFGVPFYLAGLFLLLPGGSNGFHTSKCP